MTIWNLEEEGRGDNIGKGTLKTRAGEVEVRVPMSSLPEADLVQVKDLDSSWQIFQFADGSEIRCQIQGLSDYLEALFLAGIVDVNIDKWRAAKAAAAALKAATAEYYHTITQLGGESVEEGTYGDYRSWYEIPGVPGGW